MTKLSIYPYVFRYGLSKLDPELAHHLGSWVLRAMPYLGGELIAKRTAWQREPIEAFGLTFRGPFGMAAGFDKNAHMIRGLGQLGFSHVEVGTVTPLAQPGNEAPRLFRLVADRALINRMGFNNDGVEPVVKRLKRLRRSAAAKRGKLPVVGVNIGKNKLTPNENAVDDYRRCAKAFAELADYLVINVSSPNTPGLRDLQAVSELRPIIDAVLTEAVREDGRQVPVLLKIAPDLANEDVRDVAKLVASTKLAGVIATNTTLSRAGLETPEQEVTTAGAGGLSGAPLAARSIEVLRLLAAELPADRAIISVGGVETADDVAGRLGAGANLVQGYTGFIYEGPGWASEINRAFIPA